MLKIGGFTVLGAAAATAAPWGGVLEAKTPSRLAAGRIPAPFRTAFHPAARAGPLEDHPRRGRRAGGRLQHDRAAEQGPDLPGLVTPVWSYNGSVPGPTIHVQQGRRAVVRVRNHLPARHLLLGHESTTSLHLHGSASLPQYDGYADDITRPGQYKDYHFPNHQPARTLWYHDHACTTPRRSSTPGCSPSTRCTTRPSRRCCRSASSTYHSWSATPCSPRTARWPTTTTPTRGCGAT